MIGKLEPAIYMRMPMHAMPQEGPVVRKFCETATISETIEHLRADNFALAETALRRFVANGEIPSVMCGNKALLYYPNVIFFLTGQATT